MAGNLLVSPRSFQCSVKNHRTCQAHMGCRVCSASHVLLPKILMIDYLFLHLQLAPIRMALPFLPISQPRLHQIQISLRPSCRGGPEDSETPPTCKVWMILSQVMALPKKQCFETFEDLLVF